MPVTENEEVDPVDINSLLTFLIIKKSRFLIYSDSEESDVSNTNYHFLLMKFES